MTSLALTRALPFTSRCGRVACTIRRACTALAFVATTVRAQRAADSPASAASADPDLRLRPGNTVHVTAPSVGQFEATVVRADGLDLVLRADGAERSLRLAPGDSLWVLGHSVQKGMGVGATVGLVLAVAVVGVYASSCDNGSDSPCSGQGENYARAGVAFGLTGAAVGAIIGGLRSRWAMRWP